MMRCVRVLLLQQQLTSLAIFGCHFTDFWLHGLQQQLGMCASNTVSGVSASRFTISQVRKMAFAAIRDRVPMQYLR